MPGEIIRHCHWHADGRDGSAEIPPSLYNSASSELPKMTGVSNSLSNIIDVE